MSSYIIAGSADKPETGQCEFIANQIKSYYQNIDFRIIIKHPKEWENYIHEILRIYGFKNKYDPIIFTLDGKLVGGIEGFKDLAESGFGISIENAQVENNITPEINQTIVDKEVAAKKKLHKNKKTLEEKISMCLKTKLQNQQLHAVEGYYSSYINNGLLFFLKEEHQLCPKIIVKEELTNPVQREIIVSEKLDLQAIAQTDYFVQETNQEDEQGQATNRSQDPNISKASKEEIIQQANISQEEIQPQQDQTKTESQLQSQAQIEGEQQPQPPNEDEGVQEGEQQAQQPTTEQNIENESERPITAEIVAEQQQEQQQQQEEEPEQENLISNVKTFIEPNYVNLKDSYIKQFKDEFHLAFHPNPLLDGQILMFEPVQKPQAAVEDDEEPQEQDKDDIYISDWSGAYKDRKIKKKKSKKEEQKEDQEEIKEKRKYKSKLNRDIVELDKPLSKHDWKKIKKILKKIDCVATFQILPFENKNHLPLSNNVINLYLRQFINRANRNESIIEVLEDYNKNEQELDTELLPFEKYVIDLQGQSGKLQKIGDDFIKVPNIEFDHLLFLFKDKKQKKAKNLKKLFKEMIRHMYTEEEMMQYGVNCIITRYFIMVVPLRGAYGKYHGNLLYLNPISYVGYIHLPILTKIWPHTAYKVDDLSDRKDFIKILNNSIEKTYQN